MNNWAGLADIVFGCRALPCKPPLNFFVMVRSTITKKLLFYQNKSNYCLLLLSSFLPVILPLLFKNQ
jgi:hypothetical protein